MASILNTFEFIVHDVYSYFFIPTDACRNSRERHYSVNKGSAKKVRVLLVNLFVFKLYFVFNMLRGIVGMNISKGNANNYPPTMNPIRGTFK